MKATRTSAFLLKVVAQTDGGRPNRTICALNVRTPALMLKWSSQGAVFEDGDVDLRL